MFKKFRYLFISIFKKNQVRKSESIDSLYKGWMTDRAIRILMATSILFVVGLAATIIWNMEDHTLVPTSKGANTFFFEILKAPLGAAAAALALLALMASQFRAAQQQAQIELSQSQNIYTNYFKHREHFKEKFDSIEGVALDKKAGEVTDFIVERVYDYAFPNAKKGELDCRELKISITKLFREVKSGFQEFNEILSSCKFRSKDDYYALAIELEQKISELTERINDFIESTPIRFSPAINTIVNTPNDLLQNTSYLRSYWHSVAATFDEIINCEFPDKDTISLPDDFPSKNCLNFDSTALSEGTSSLDIPWR